MESNMTPYQLAQAQYQTIKAVEIGLALDMAMAETEDERKFLATGHEFAVGKVKEVEERMSAELFN